MEGAPDFSSYPERPIPLIVPEVSAGREKLVAHPEALDLLRRIVSDLVAIIHAKWRALNNFAEYSPAFPGLRPCGMRPLPNRKVEPFELAARPVNKP